MAQTATINKLKVDLRISHNALDSDLADQVDACIADLRMCGIVEPFEDDPLILAAIKLWARANFTDDAGKASAFISRYDAMKGSLMMARGYGGAARED